jgi:TonB family protein
LTPAVKSASTYISTEPPPLLQRSFEQTGAGEDILLLTPPELDIGIPKPEPVRLNEGIGMRGRTYHPTSALTQRPSPVEEPKVILPDGWLEASGQVVITLYINMEGNVDEALINRTNLAPELQNAVVHAFKKLDFAPGEIGGRPVDVVMTIEVDLTAMLGKLH